MGNDPQREIVIINRIPTLRKLTVAALVRFGWENIKEFSDLSGGSTYLSTHKDNCILILELNVIKAEREVELVKQFQKDIPIIVTMNVPNKTPDKKLILNLSQAGAMNIILKTHDISEYSNKLDDALQSYIKSKTLS